MKIRVGFELVYEFAQSTPMVLMLNVHPSRTGDLLKPDQLQISPLVPVTPLSRCVRQYLPPSGRACGPDRNFHRRHRRRFRTCPMRSNPTARQHEVGELPHEALVFLLASRYCETERLMNLAWSHFGKTPAGWPRVQAICDFVHSHVRFGYPHARAHTHRHGHVRRAPRRVPRLRAPGRHAVPLHEHSGALLHRLSRRHRRAARARADGFQRLVRGLSRRPLVHLRRPPQRAAHRPDRDGARPRRRRRGVQHHVRSRTCSSDSPWSPTRSWRGRSRSDVPERKVA